MNETGSLRFYGGTAGALAPFVLFLVGVAWLGLSGARIDTTTALDWGLIDAVRVGSHDEVRADSRSDRK